jgi:hypothetical protein|tara:strand:- start:5839 stop:6429 length:591 start_codon:yes stop_codon:yes gene_type:complete
MKPKQKPHYVNNKQFSQSVVDYVKTVKAAEAEGKQLPVVPDYIAQCFLKIAQGLSHKANFIRYTYREEMVMDAVENCLKAITNYNIDAQTRTGNPNAFAYFTQICYYAFLRRLAKEKKQQDIKFKYIEKAGIEDFVFQLDGEGTAADSQTRAFVDQLKDRISVVRQNDATLKEFAKEEKKKSKPSKPKALELFMGA